MYAYFLIIVVPNHEIMIWQETYVSCDETEMSLQEGASNTLNTVLINDLVPKGVHENRTKGVENKVDDTLKLVVFLECAQC